MARITHYEIEGELLTREQIMARTGQKESIIKYRLGKGNRTWANLQRPVGDAAKESRRRLDSAMMRSPELRNHAKREGEKNGK